MKWATFYRLFFSSIVPYSVVRNFRTTEILAFHLSPIQFKNRPANPLFARRSVVLKGVQMPLKCPSNSLLIQRLLECDSVAPSHDEAFPRIVQESAPVANNLYRARPKAQQRHPSATKLSPRVGNNKGRKSHNRGHKPRAYAHAQQQQQRQHNNCDARQRMYELQRTLMPKRKVNPRRA